VLACCCLLLSKPNPEAADTWTWLILAAYTQLVRGKTLQNPALAGAGRQVDMHFVVT
jgi:hypothetical protein